MLLGIFQSRDFTNVFAELGRREATGEVIYPPVYNLFSWTRVDGCPPDKVKAVIVGQDPVADVKATGIAFMFIEPATSNNAVRNMLNVVPGGNTLPLLHPIKWCEQGVLMINNVPTIGCFPTKVAVPAMSGVPVKEKIEMETISHCYETKKKPGVGWENFTQQLVKALLGDIIYVLFGTKAAKNLKTLILEKQCILYPHPSPKWSRAQWEARVKEGKFTDEVNARLTNNQVKTITWGISPEYSIKSLDECIKGVIYVNEVEAQQAVQVGMVTRGMGNVHLQR